MNCASEHLPKVDLTHAASDTSPTSQEPFHISLAADLRPFVAEESSRRGFVDEAAFVESLIRDARRSDAKKRAEQLVLEGVKSGQPAIADEAFWARFTRELHSRLKLPKSA